jgi:hypothetical protein
VKGNKAKVVIKSENRRTKLTAKGGPLSKSMDIVAAAKRNATSVKVAQNVGKAKAQRNAAVNQVCTDFYYYLSFKYSYYKFFHM